MKAEQTTYRFRIYYIVRDREVIGKFCERFRTTANVNYISDIVTDDAGRELLEESERRGFIQIRELKKKDIKP